MLEFEMEYIGIKNRMPVWKWSKIVEILALKDSSFDFLVEAYRRRDRIESWRDTWKSVFLRVRWGSKAASEFRTNRIFTEICIDQGTMNSHWDSTATDRRWAIYGMSIPMVNYSELDGERLDSMAMRIADEHGKEDSIWRLPYEDFLHQHPRIALIQLLHFSEHRSL
jgi:hypothetical protein